ncbi:hypothetical protein [Gilvimarinus chinensis]|uniref:hypothetical protein n=1 Tax=Gilvimarinus chinensis TaxID=396005 RepID=UPI0012FA6DE9|nr:hypothetical protein [Gilvimarinus chinensis]
MKKLDIYICITALFFLLAMSLSAYLAAIEDPRFDGGAITNEEMHWYESLIVLGALIGSFTTWLIALSSAYSHRFRKWFLAIFILLPLAWVYLYFHSREGSSH